MPVRPAPRHYHCPACGWRKTVAPRSDALLPGDFYGACPECRHTPLDSSAASTLEGVLAGPANDLKRLLGQLKR